MSKNFTFTSLCGYSGTVVEIVLVTMYLNIYIIEKFIVKLQLMKTLYKNISTIHIPFSKIHLIKYFARRFRSVMLLFLLMVRSIKFQW